MYTESYLLGRYNEKKQKIKQRLKEFEQVGKEADDSRLFQELAFCICTPQSKGRNCWKAIENASASKALWEGDSKAIAKELQRLVRFHHTKGQRIVEARERFFNGGSFSLKSELSTLPVERLRDRLVEQVNGYGYKAATQFLRNIGKGKNFAILDRHIFRNMIRYGVIREEPSSVSEKPYKEIEEKLRKFAKKVNIPVEELDLLWWSEEEGTIFK